MKQRLSGILTLLLVLVVQIAFAQERVVSGTVTGPLGTPLPGVNVVVKNSNRGTQTDFDGFYSLSVNDGDMLVFSYLGFENVEYLIGSTTPTRLDVQLKEDASELEEVVVVAYGTQKRAAIVGAVSSVTAETIENVPIASFDQILKGQAPGLHVISGSGQPGTAAKVRIRGTHSINGGSTPLYILDGVPITEQDFATLNPNDFESVSVLKDAASTSIYGSRGASGVIVITTKSGNFDTPTRIQYSTQYGLSEVGQKRFGLMSGPEKMIYENILNPGKFTDEEIANAPDVDWSDVFFRTGTTKTHDLSVSGGSEKTRFYTSLSYYDQEGIGLRSNLQRFNYRINLDHKVSERVNTGGNVSMGYSKSNFIAAEAALNTNNPFAAAYLAQPYIPIFGEDGYWNVGVDEFGNTKLGPNALENLNRNISKRADLKLLASFYGEAELIKNVTARVDMGVDYRGRTSEAGSSPETYYGQNAVDFEEGHYSYTNSYIANINTIAALRYNNTWNEIHSLSLGAFTEYYKYHFQSGFFTGYGINPKLVGYAQGVTNEAAYLPSVGGSVNERGLFSYFGNLKYNYAEKYYLDLTARRDASSRFSEANKWGTFWAVGASWNISEEPFMEAADWVDNLKLRGSYGTSGNESGIGSFQDQGTYGTTSYNGIPGITVASIGNDQLKWEESAKLDIGIDFDFFNNRISGSVDWYEEIISDLFINQSLSASSGFGFIDANAGKMRNRGWDGFLKAHLIRTPDFGFSVNGNFTYNQNEILDLGQEDEYELGTSIIREGLAYGSHYIVGWAGVNPATGQPLYLDADGNITTVYNAANSTANWGSFEPIWTGGFGAELRFKGFSVSSLFTYAQDYYRFNNQSFFMENANFGESYNMSTEMFTMWQFPGQITDIQGAGFNREFTSKDIEDASYVRLTNLTASFRLPPAMLEATGVFENVRVFVLGQNLYTWTNYTGFDPEDSNNIAHYEYPTPRTITFGVDLTF